jgi:uncharacterized RDD family membrane protein YckC
MPYCTHCGAEETADQQFCSNCGQATAGDFAGPGPMPYFAGEEPFAKETGLAGYWWRVLGYIIDAIILAIVTLPLRAAHLEHDVHSIVSVIIVFVYLSVSLIFMNGQTLGMRVVSLRCVDDASRSTLTRPQVLKRTSLYCVLVVINGFYTVRTYSHPTSHQRLVQGQHEGLLFILYLPLLLDFLWPIWDKKNQTLHDKFASTVVLRTKS